MYLKKIINWRAYILLNDEEKKFVEIERARFSIARKIIFV